MACSVSTDIRLRHAQEAWQRKTKSTCYYSARRHSLWQSSYKNLDETPSQGLEVTLFRQWLLVQQALALKKAGFLRVC